MAMTLSPNRLIVTGGIGSGKSAVRRRLGELGYHEIDADAIGHGVLLPDGAAFAEVKERWPQVVVAGEIDRAALGRIVFSDEGQLRELEAITHPHIFDMIEAEVQRIDAPVVVELPILTQSFSGWTRVVVDSSSELRLERAVRRGSSPEDVEARMHSQPSRDQWLACADVVVPNNGSLEDLHDSVDILAGHLSNSVPG